jgi:iron complex outermembrane recepter protein
VQRALSATPSFDVEQTFGQYSQSRTLLDGGGALNEAKTLAGRASVSYDARQSNRDFVQNRLAAFSGTLAWAGRRNFNHALEAASVLAAGT